MTKELIRNGGFERGNLDFWSCEHGTAEVVSDVKKRGNYAAKLITGSCDYGVFVTKDYISVSPYELYRALLWLKNVSWSTVYLYIWLYDSDYNLIAGESIKIGEKSGTFNWTKFDKFFVVPAEASYIILRIYVTGIQGSYGYIDSVSIHSIEADRLAVYPEELISKTNFTSTGTFYSDEFFSGLWKYGEFYLDVSSLTGTSPTLDVTIQAYDPMTGIWKDIVKFDQATSSGSQLKVATAGLGWKVRVKYTTGGTITDCDFKVGVIFKR